MPSVRSPEMLYSLPGVVQQRPCALAGSTPTFPGPKLKIFLRVYKHTPLRRRTYLSLSMCHCERMSEKKHTADNCLVFPGVEQKWHFLVCLTGAEGVGNQSCRIHRDQPFSQLVVLSNLVNGEGWEVQAILIHLFSM